MTKKKEKKSEKKGLEINPNPSDKEIKLINLLTLLRDFILVDCKEESILLSAYIQGIAVILHNYDDEDLIILYSDVGETILDYVNRYREAAKKKYPT